MQEQFNRKAQPHSFAPGQWVLLRDFTVLGKNAKLAPKWRGPFKIISLRGSHNLLIHLADGKRTKLVNIENVKPYHEAPEKPVYNLERPERNENSEDFETEIGAERTHHVHLKKIQKEKILIKLMKPWNLRHFSKGGRDWQLVKILNSQNHQEGLPEAKLEE